MATSTTLSEKARQLMQGLHDAARNNTLTTAQLSEAVRFVYDDGDDYNHSVGASWIWENHAHFALVLPDAEKFFRQHLPILASTSTGRPELFSLIPQERRTAYLQDVITTHPMRSFQWVTTAFQCGVCRQDIAHLIRVVIEKNPRYYGDSFIVYGAGSLPASWKPQVLRDDQPWAMFDDTELKEVMRLCMPHLTNEVLQQRQKLTIRFGEEATQQLCVEAAGHLQSGVDPNLLKLMPLDTRLGLARRVALEPGDHRTQASAQLICGVVMDLVQAGRPELAEASTFLEKIAWAPTLYTAAHTLGRPVPDWLEKILTDRLTRDGFIMGTLECGEHTPKGATRPVSQLQLRHGDQIFVQERRQSGYYPREGERVIVQPSQAKHLATCGTTRIFAAYFTPATSLRT